MRHETKIAAGITRKVLNIIVPVNFPFLRQFIWREDLCWPMIAEVSVHGQWFICF